MRMITVNAGRPLLMMTFLVSLPGDLLLNQLAHVLHAWCRAAWK